MNFLKLRNKLREEKILVPNNEIKNTNDSENKEKLSLSPKKVFDFNLSLNIDKESCIQYNNIPKLLYYSNILSVISNTNLNSEKDLFDYFEYERKWTELRSGRLLQEYVLDPISNSFNCPIIDQLVKICNDIQLLSFSHTKIEEAKNEIPLINHVLVNRYGPDDGILHHEDGPCYYPSVAIISLNESCILSWKEKLKSNYDKGKEKHKEKEENNDNDVCEIFLEPNSCVLFSHDLYNSYLHGIEASHYQHVSSSSSTTTTTTTTTFDSDSDGSNKNCVCVNRDKCKINEQNGCFERHGVRISLTLRHKYVS